MKNPLLSSWRLKAICGITSLAIVAAIWSILASTHLFPYFSPNNDEPVYLSQAQTLLEGKLAVPKTETSAFFMNWFQGERGEKIVYKYSPVHAFWLALCRLFFGTFRAALPLTAALNVVMLYFLAREVGNCRRTALFAVLFFLVSPFFLAASATYLSYSSFLFLALSFSTMFFRAVRLRSRNLLLAAGAILGIAFFARPYDALLLGSAILIPHLLSHKHKHNHKQTRFAVWLLAGFLPVSLLTPIYNYLQTGSPISFPFALDPSDTLGFGLKRLHPTGEYLLYDVSKASFSLFVSLWRSCFWTFGGPILFSLATYYGIFQRRSKAELSLFWIIFLLPAGYFFFWGSYHSIWAADLDTLGPNYYLPVLVPICLFGARYFAVLTRGRPSVRGLLIALMFIPTVICFEQFIVSNLKVTGRMRKIYSPVETAKLVNALVMVPPVWGPYLLHPFAYLMNSFESQMAGNMFAVDRGMDNFRLWDKFPNHRAYRFEYFGPQELNASELVPLTLTLHQRWTFQIRVKNPTDRRAVDVSIKSGNLHKRINLDVNSSKKASYVLECAVDQQQGVVIRREDQTVLARIPLSLEAPLQIAVEFNHVPAQYAPLNYQFEYVFRHLKGGGFEVTEPPSRASIDLAGKRDNDILILPKNESLLSGLRNNPRSG